MIAVLLSACWVGSKEPSSDQEDLEDLILSIDLASDLPEFYSDWITPDKYYACRTLESTVSLTPDVNPELSYAWFDTSSGEEVQIGDEYFLVPSEMNANQSIFLRVTPTIDDVVYPSKDSETVVFERLGIFLGGPTENPTAQNSVVDGIHAELEISDGLNDDIDFEDPTVNNDCDGSEWKFKLTWYSSNHPDFMVVTNSDTLSLFPCETCTPPMLSELQGGDEWELRIEASVDGGPFEYNNSIFTTYNELPYVLNNSPVAVSDTHFEQFGETTLNADVFEALNCVGTVMDYDSDQIGLTTYSFEYYVEEEGWVVIQKSVSSQIGGDGAIWFPQDLSPPVNNWMLRCQITTEDQHGEYIYTSDEISVYQ
jgi:hypothetical protein